MLTTSESFVSFLGVPTCRDGSLLPMHQDAPCPFCCHWSHPLTLTPRTYNGVAVPLSYPEWLVYAWHIGHHQRGVPIA